MTNGNLICSEKIVSIWLACTQYLFLLKLIYRMTKSIVKYPYSRNIFGVVKTTFMLEIRFVCNIHQNITVFNRFSFFWWISSWITIEHIRWMDGKGSMRNTWVLMIEKISLKLVRNWMAYSSSLCSWAFLTALQRYRWAHVQICRGWWELSSSHNPFNSRKYSISYLDFFSSC